MGDIIGHKDRQIWLPSHTLQDPLFDHSNKHKKSVKNHHNHHRAIGGFHHSAGPPLGETRHLNYNTTRQKKQNKWQMAKGDERMQAFFLISPGPTTSGTGVFLPTTAFLPPTKKPVCSPVLLPARVVQALNLNVHNNGLHISPRSEARENDDSKKKSEMGVTSMDTKVEIPMDSPEKLLPEEWIY